jgi:hypothetical protein
MSQIVAVQLPDKVYHALQKTAADAGMTSADWIASMIAQCFPLETDTRNEEEKQQARDRFYQMCGFFTSGDPHGSDNERIDADLAREYGNGLEQEP